ncbi:unnamed protein product [Caenorhabditis bovis]|uniref:Uncharacterized protein n=1 Tax=Caenorhabditis bovis TaxID=2654633 RepID=A0A8S1END6_9PELO|nr:unnamed protein product [Caenorhabditis bovis]
MGDDVIIALKRSRTEGYDGTAIPTVTLEEDRSEESAAQEENQPTYYAYYVVDINILINAQTSSIQQEEKNTFTIRNDALNV